MHPLSQYCVWCPDFASASEHTAGKHTVCSVLPRAWHKSVLFTAHNLAYMEIFTEMEKNGCSGIPLRTYAAMHWSRSGCNIAYKFCILKNKSKQALCNCKSVWKKGRLKKEVFLALKQQFHRILFLRVDDFLCEWVKVWMERWSLLKMEKMAYFQAQNLSLNTK